MEQNSETDRRRIPRNAAALFTATDTRPTPVLYDEIRAHCNGGVRLSEKRPGHLLIGCGNFERVKWIVCSALSVGNLSRPIAERKRALDVAIAFCVSENTKSNLSRDEAFQIVKNSGSLTKEVLQGFMERHAEAMGWCVFETGGDRLTAVISHMAKTILFMEAYSFLADMYLDKNGNWR